MANCKLNKISVLKKKNQQNKRVAIVRSWQMIDDFFTCKYCNSPVILFPTSTDWYSRKIDKQIPDATLSIEAFSRDRLYNIWYILVYMLASKNSSPFGIIF